MAQNHIDKTKEAIKAKLDEILSDYLATDAQIEAGLKKGKFFGSFEYYQLEAKKAALIKGHHKLTNALVAIEEYM